MLLKPRKWREPRGQARAEADTKSPAECSEASFLQRLHKLPATARQALEKQASNHLGIKQLLPGY